MKTHWKIDFHLHTAEDEHDGFSQPSCPLVEKAATLGFDAIAITLHEKQKDLPEAVELGQKLGVLVIPGTELTLEGKHILAIGLPTDVANEIQSPQDLTLAKAGWFHHCLIAAPHPFYPIPSALGKRDFQRHQHLFDAVEITQLHCPITRGYNDQAAKMASLGNLPLLGNSDAHLSEHFGVCHTLVTSEGKPLSKENLFAQIRAGKVVHHCPLLHPIKLGKTIFRILTTSAKHKFRSRKNNQEVAAPVLSE